MTLRRVANTLMLLAFYTLAFIIFTYPLITDFGSCFISDGKDGCVFPWNIYNFREAVLHGQNPFVTDRIFYPVGSSLVFHVYAPITGVVGLFTPNCVLALNISVLLSFVFSGLGAYLLARRYLASDLLAALAGFAFAYCPYKLTHIYGHYDLLLTASIPFFIIFMLKAFTWTNAEPGGQGMPGGPGAKRRRLARPRVADRKSLVLACLFYALTFFSCYYYAYFLLIFVALYALYFGLGLHSLRLLTKRRVVYALVIIAASSLTVGLLHLAGLYREGLPRIGLGQSADVLAFLVPSAYSRFLASDLVKHLHLDVIRANEVESTVYVGYAILVFIVAYFVRRQYRKDSPEAKMLAFITGAFLIFAAPIVLVADRIICALPTALLHYVPFLNNFRVPYRFDVMLMLFAPVLGCIFIERRLLPRLAKPWRHALPAALLAILFIEYWPATYPTVSRHDVPPVYQYLSARPDGTLLEIPFGLRDGFRMIGDERTIQMYYQTIHHKEILGGLVSRPNKALFSQFERERIVGDLLALEEAHVAGSGVSAGSSTTAAIEQRSAEISPAEVSPEEARRFLERFAVRYVLIYPEYRGTSLQKYVEAGLAPFISERNESGGFLLLVLDSRSAAR